MESSTATTNKIKPFAAIVAYCRANNGIGKDNQLPWPRIRRDMKHFADVTSSREPLALGSAEVASKSLFFNSGLAKAMKAKK